MKTKQILALTVLVLVACSLAILGGCKKEAPAPTEGDVVTYANAKCPIMGSVINPEKITADLVKDFKGEKVALCCAGCPAKWDALSDEEKAAKLAAAK